MSVKCLPKSFVDNPGWALVIEPGHNWDEVMRSGFQGATEYLVQYEFCDPGDNYVFPFLLIKVSCSLDDLKQYRVPRLVGCPDPTEVSYEDALVRGKGMKWSIPGDVLNTWVTSMVIVPHGDVLAVRRELRWYYDNPKPDDEIKF
jgi:hypothetical protein